MNNKIVHFDEFVKNLLGKYNKVEPNGRTINTIDFLIDVVKNNASSLIEGLINISGISTEDFSKLLEEFRSNYSEKSYYTALYYEHSNIVRNYKKYSGFLQNCVYLALNTVKSEGKDVVSSNDIVRQIFKTPPIEFIAFLEEKCDLKAEQISRYFAEN